MSQVTIHRTRTISHIGPLQIAIIILAVATALVHLDRGLMMTLFAPHFAGGPRPLSGHFTGSNSPSSGHFAGGPPRAGSCNSEDASVNPTLLSELPGIHCACYSALSATFEAISADYSLARPRLRPGRRPLARHRPGTPRSRPRPPGAPRSAARSQR